MGAFWQAPFLDRASSGPADRAYRWMTMDDRYEIAPEPVGRAAGRRRPIAAIALTVALVVGAVVVAKPWAAPARSQDVALPGRPAVAAASAETSTPDPRALAGTGDRPDLASGRRSDRARGADGEAGGGRARVARGQGRGMGRR